MAESPSRVRRKKTMHSQMNVSELLNITANVPDWIIGDDLSRLHREAGKIKKIRNQNIVAQTLIGLAMFSICTFLVLTVNKGLEIDPNKGLLAVILSVGAILFTAGYVWLLWLLNLNLPSIRISVSEEKTLKDLERLKGLDDTPSFTTPFSNERGEITIRGMCCNILRSYASQIENLESVLDTAACNADSDALRARFEERFWLYKTFGLISPDSKKSDFFTQKKQG